MRVLVTGATGFVAGRLAAALRRRGDDVVALVRSRERGATLAERGCELVEGDIVDADAVGRAVEGCDAVVHAAAVYRIGIPHSEREAMWRVNVDGTDLVLRTAIAAGAHRVVYVSTASVFGDTRGKVVDETFERSSPPRFVSAYDETKYFAHLAALGLAGEGPVLIAMPGVVYGPGDTSQIGAQLRRAQAGTLRYVSFPTLGFNAVHVDDVAAGLLLVVERGSVGESYVLGGELTTMRDLIATAARVAGRRPPR